MIRWKAPIGWLTGIAPIGAARKSGGRIKTSAFKVRPSVQLRPGWEILSGLRSAFRASSVPPATRRWRSFSVYRPGQATRAQRLGAHVRSAGAPHQCKIATQPSLGISRFSVRVQSSIPVTTRMLNRVLLANNAKRRLGAYRRRPRSSK